MKILVTGPNGFVGKVLCASLLQHGHNLHKAVRSAGAIIDDDRKYNSQSAETVHVGDIAPETDWSRALTAVDVVIHLAARVHVMRDRERDPLSAFRKVNTHGTLNLARQAVQHGVQRMVYVSSIKVNGESTAEAAFCETDLPNPKDPYAISKWEAEQGLAGLARETGLEIVVVRPPLVYGPGVKGNFLSLLRLLELGLPLPLQRCDNLRSLLALENLVDLLVCCATHPAAAGETFLVSDGEDVSTTDLMHRLGDAMGHPAHLWPVPSAWLRLALRLIGQDAVYERLCGSLQVDSGKARQVMGWMPPVSVDEGLRLTAQWYLARQ